jgi:hypothetical protein
MQTRLAQIAFDLVSIAEDRAVSTSKANHVFFLPLNKVVRSDVLLAAVAHTPQRPALLLSVSQMSTSLHPILRPIPPRLPR